MGRNNLPRDIYRMGDVRIQATQPRYPCWKLAQGGWYNPVLNEGCVGAGLRADGRAVEDDAATAELATMEALSLSWRRMFYGRAFAGIEE